jgi:hypothetical protein
LTSTPIERAAPATIAMADSALASINSQRARYGAYRDRALTDLEPYLQVAQRPLALAG